MHAYWIIKLYGHHLIRAASPEEALAIAIRHDIGRKAADKAFRFPYYPPRWGRAHRIGWYFAEASKGFRDKIIAKRRRGQSGRIWCEDENGNLMIETEEGDKYPDETNKNKN